MKEMTLQDVQAVSLGILKHLDSFCKEHKIKYSLGYGSLIGAIRHKGFIPWDDDLDVVMMRDDFERFCSIYEDTSEYKLFSVSRGNMYQPMGRLCEMQNTLVKTALPLFTEQTGVWIDIFPLDSVDEDKQRFDERKYLIEESHKRIWQCRYYMREWKGVRSLVHIKDSLLWLLNVRNARKTINQLVNYHNDLCINFASSDSKMMSMLVFPVYIQRDWSPKNVFEETIPIPFEDTCFQVMKGYDEWLRIIYGDYMQLPPEEKRKAGHSSHRFYWK